MEGIVDVKVEYVIEIMNTKGEWHRASGPLTGPQATPGLAEEHRAEVTKMLRENGGIGGRYTRTRIMKVTTTGQQVGAEEEI